MRRLVLAACLLTSSTYAANESPTFGFGTTPGPDELGRFVSPLADGRGLPKGSGSVADGEKVYQAQCMACHGAALEGGIGDRLVGGRGTLVNADPKKAPMKTVESYWPYATTLFDYIKRAMPLMSPGSLSDDEVYAVSAYVLSKANIVPADAVLDQSTLAKVQMPNRDGFIPDHRPEKFPSVADSLHAQMAIPAPAK
jgi:cytochrome c